MSIVDGYDFTHPLDRQTLNSLKAIPGFSKAIKAYMRLVSDRQIHLHNMSSKLLLGPNQLPEIYNLLPPVCERLGIEVPPLYLVLDPNPNAYTRGDNLPEITLTSGLLDLMSDDEIQVVMAHECGHIVCHHVLYHQIGTIILSGASGAIGVPIISQALNYAFLTWMRCSEFSADRAAGLFAGDSTKVARMLMRFTGCPARLDESTSLELFMSQAESYDAFMNDSGWNKFLGTMAYLGNDHPLTAVRANEITKWMANPEVQRVVADLNSGVFKPTITQFDGRVIAPGAPNLLGEGSSKCPSCGGENQPGSSFCGFCGAPMMMPPSICPSCGTPATPGSRFCVKCGNALAAPVGGAITPMQPSNVLRKPLGQKGTDRIRENLNGALNGLRR